MHEVRVGFYGGQFFGICICGWQSGFFDTEDGAIGACITHEQSQQN